MSHTFFSFAPNGYLYNSPVGKSHSTLPDPVALRLENPEPKVVEIYNASFADNGAYFVTYRAADVGKYDFQGIESRGLSPALIEWLGQYPKYKRHIPSVKVVFGPYGQHYAWDKNGHHPGAVLPAVASSIQQDGGPDANPPRIMALGPNGSYLIVKKNGKYYYDLVGCSAEADAYLDRLCDIPAWPNGRPGALDNLVDFSMSATKHGQWFSIWRNGTVVSAVSSEWQKMLAPTTSIVREYLSTIFPEGFANDKKPTAQVTIAPIRLNSPVSAVSSHSQNSQSPSLHAPQPVHATPPAAQLQDGQLLQYQQTQSPIQELPSGQPSPMQSVQGQQRPSGFAHIAQHSHIPAPQHGAQIMGQQFQHSGQQQHSGQVQHGPPSHIPVAQHHSPQPHVQLPQTATGHQQISPSSTPHYAQQTQASQGHLAQPVQQQQGQSLQTQHQPAQHQHHQSQSLVHPQPQHAQTHQQHPPSISVQQQPIPGQQGHIPNQPVQQQYVGSPQPHSPGMGHHGHTSSISCASMTSSIQQQVSSTHAQHTMNPAMTQRPQATHTQSAPSIAPSTQSFETTSSSSKTSKRFSKLASSAKKFGKSAAKVTKDAANQVQNQVLGSSSSAQGQHKPPHTATQQHTAQTGHHAQPTQVVQAGQTANAGGQIQYVQRIVNTPQGQQIQYVQIQSPAPTPQPAKPTAASHIGTPQPGQIVYVNQHGQVVQPPAQHQQQMIAHTGSPQPGQQAHQVMQAIQQGQQAQQVQQVQQVHRPSVVQTMQQQPNQIQQHPPLQTHIGQAVPHPQATSTSPTPAPQASTQVNVQVQQQYLQLNSTSTPGPHQRPSATPKPQASDRPLVSSPAGREVNANAKANVNATVEPTFNFSPTFNFGGGKEDERSGAGKSGPGYQGGRPPQHQHQQQQQQYQQQQQQQGTYDYGYAYQQPAVSYQPQPQVIYEQPGIDGFQETVVYDPNGTVVVEDSGVGVGIGGYTTETVGAPDYSMSTGYVTETSMTDITGGVNGMALQTTEVQTEQFSYVGVDAGSTQVMGADTQQVVFTDPGTYGMSDSTQVVATDGNGQIVDYTNTTVDQTVLADGTTDTQYQSTEVMTDGAGDMYFSQDTLDVQTDAAGDVSYEATETEYVDDEGGEMFDDGFGSDCGSLI